MAMITGIVFITISLQIPVSTYSKIIGHVPWYKSSKHYWPLNDIDKDKHLVDVTGSGTSRVYGGAETVPGVSKNALKLDGVISTGANLGDFAGSCLSLPSLCKYGFTVSFWLRLDASGIILSHFSHQVVLQLSRSLDAVGPTIYAKKNTIGFTVNDRNVSRNIEVYWNYTDWVHVSLIWNKLQDSVKVLLDCSPKPYKKQTERPTRLPMIPAQNQLWLGSNYAQLKNSKVEVDELAIWYEVLTVQDLCYIKLARTVDGGYSQWSNFSSCSVSCGDGTRTRTRTCTSPPSQHGGKSCSVIGPSQESIACFLRNCPIDGNYTSWSVYTPCTKSCGGGVRTRFRTCSKPVPQYGGKNCSRYGESIDKIACNVDNCPINGGYTQWSNYSECSVSCGDGVRTRTRTCSNPVPRYGGRDCSHLGETRQTKDCFIKVCPVDGNYSTWSTFSACSRTCGSGVKTRSRKCDSPAPGGGGRDCLRFGLPVESVACNTHRCPTNGGYSSWSSFSVCSRSCEGGTQFRTRNCTNPPPMEGGMNCSRLGPPMETRSCNTDPCPVDGGYGPWSGYSQCTVTCRGGRMFRFRKCDSPKPSYGGRDCSNLGPDEETKTCNTGDCPDITFVSTMVFTKEVFRAEMYETTTEAFKEHTKKVKWNLSKLYGPDSALKDVVISFCQQSETVINRNSGVQCKLEFRFSSSRYDGIVKLQDALQIKRYIYEMPVTSFFINSVDVPTDYKLQVQAYNTSSRSIMVTWVPSAKRVIENVEGYRIMYTDEMGNSYSTVVHGADSDRRELTNLRIYHDYCIRVIPYSRRGDGLAAFPVCAYTDQGVPTGSPTNLTVEIRNTSALSITWNKPGKDVVHGELLGYKLMYGRVNYTYYGGMRFDSIYNITLVMVDSVMLDLAPTANQMYITGLKRFTMYAVKIAVYNPKGRGKWSEAVAVRTGEDVPGKAPFITSVYNVSSTTLRVTWYPIPEEYLFGRLLGYRIFYKDTTTTNTTDYESFDVGPGAHEADVTGLTKYRDYIVQVAGFNRKGEGKPSKGVIVSTDEDVPSLPPQQLTVANVSSTILLVQWNPVPEEHHNGIILGYRILYKMSEIANTLLMTKDCSPLTRAAKIKNLLKFTAYDVQVTAYTSKGNGALSDVVTARTAEDKPSQPPTLMSFHNTSSNSLRVTWLHIPPEYVHGILLGYRVLYRSLNVTEDMYSVTEVGQTESHVVLENLYKYMDYGVRVLGFTGTGHGTVSDEVIVRTDQDGKLYHRWTLKTRAYGAADARYTPTTVPSWPPEHVTASNKTSPTKTLVRWQPISNPYYIHGILLGYKVLYRAVSNPDAILHDDEKVVVLGSDTFDVTLENLTSYTRYSINVLAFTNKGDGVPSPTIYAETCNCHKSMYTNWWINPPYMDDNHTGIFPSILKTLITTCCGHCAEHSITVIHFQNSSAVSYALKSDETQMKEHIDSTTELSFPVYGRMEQLSYNDFAFVPLVESGGTVFMTIAEEPGTTARVVVSSVFDMWPMCMVLFVSAFFAGFLMWIMDCFFNAKEFPKSPFRGPLEGMWWAFITMTTLGYGDRVPKGFHSKSFGIVWITCGLVIVSLFMSLITTTLTTEVIGKGKMVYGSNVAAILNSSEYRLGIRMNANMDNGVVYNNLMDVYGALKQRTVDGALIDGYSVGSRQDLFSDPELIISKVISHQSSSYGVVLAGDAQRLQTCFRSFLKDERSKVFAAITSNVRPLEGLGARKNDKASSLFDAESGVFQQALIWTSSLLGFVVVIFLFYELSKRKRRNPHPKRYDFSDQANGLFPVREKISQSEENYNYARELMLKLVREFHSNCKIKVLQLRAKHKRELKELQKMKEQEELTGNKEEMNAKKSLLEGARKALLRFVTGAFSTPTGTRV